MATWFETVFSDAIFAVLAIIFTVFTALNLAGQKFGSFGVKFLYEMDEIMGGLIGIPNYSKVEAVFTGFGALGLCTVILGEQYSTYVIYGAALLEAYMLLCVGYAYFAKQPIAPFAVMVLVLDIMTGHRWLRFENSILFFDMMVISVILFALVGAGIYRMYKRAEERKEINERFLAIGKYCEDNPGFVWEYGNDAPNGFEYVKSAEIA